MTRILLVSVSAFAVLVATVAEPVMQTPQTQSPQTPQQPRDISPTISSDQAGTQPRFAVPGFLALTSDAETQDAAATMTQVLISDLGFEREFAIMPRDIVSTIPAATSVTDVPFDRWREVNADGVIMGSVQKTGQGVRVEVRVFSIRSRQLAFGREYTGAIVNKRSRPSKLAAM